MSRVLCGVFACLLLTSGCKTDNAASDPRVLLDLKKKCVEAGERARAARLKMYPVCREGDPRYTYNNELKTCLYADKCLYGGSDGAAYYFIMDAFSNSVVIQYDNCFRMTANGSIQARCEGDTFPDLLPELPNSDSNAFASKFHELFGSKVALPALPQGYK